MRGDAEKHVMIKGVKKYMSTIYLILFIIGYFVIMRYVLPRFGVST